MDPVKASDAQIHGCLPADVQASLAIYYRCRASPPTNWWVVTRPTKVPFAGPAGVTSSSYVGYWINQHDT